MRRCILRIIILCASVMLFSACSTMGVEAWERDILAKDEMQLVADPLEVAIDDHIYFSKEAFSGGRGFGGGGCGCNWQLVEMNRDNKKPHAVARDNLDSDRSAPIPMSSMLDVGYLSNRIGDVDKDVIDIVAGFTQIIAQLSYRFGK